MALSNVYCFWLHPNKGHRSEWHAHRVVPAYRREPLFDTIHGFEIGADAGAYYGVGWIIQLEKPTRQEVMDFGKGLDYSTEAYVGFGFTLILNIGFPPTNGIAFGFGFAGGNSYGISDTLSAYQNAERL